MGSKEEIKRKLREILKSEEIEVQEGEISLDDIVKKIICSKNKESYMSRIKEKR